MRISLVVAIADNGVIGRSGGLPWHLPDDLRHFRTQTIGRSVLMGRRTFEAIGHALPGRQNLVLSHSASPLAASGVQRVASLQEAVACSRQWGGEQAQLCVIGGAQVYALALAYACRIDLTQVHASVAGDVYFPGWQPPGEQGSALAGWRESARSWHPPDARHAYAMSFVTLDPLQAPPAV